MAKRVMPQSLVIQPKLVMKGFCYAFSKALLERLKGLVEKDVAYASKEESKLTPLASSIVVKLTEQLDAPEHCEHTSTYVRIKDFHLRELIKLGEDFLSIFDK